MQQVQIYINDERVEMFDFESVTITDTIKDVRDVSKIFTEYSQTFSLPASKSNNKIFKHYYNSDIVNSFDSRVRVPAKIELNSIPFKDGYIQLEGVDLRNNKAQTYRVTFFGNTVSLKDLLGDDLLSSLSWLDNFSSKENGLELSNSMSDIKDYLTNNVNKTVDGTVYNNPIQVPLITHTQRLFYDSSANVSDSENVHYHTTSSFNNKHGVKYNELKYALRINLIIKAIEEKYGLSFSNDFFNNSNNDAFNNLYMWLHRVKGKITSGGQVELSVFNVNTFTNNSSNDGSFMNNNILNITDGASFRNQSLALSLTLASGSTSIPYSINVFRNGIPTYQASNVVGNIIDVPITVSDGSEYTIEISCGQAISFTSAKWTYSYRDGNEDFTYENYVSGSFNITIGSFDFGITQQIPKMKVLDFLTAIFKMFNLVAYVEGSTMIVKDLDTFYANPSNGSPYDITKYVDVNSSQVNSVLPFREVVFGYEGLGTFLAKRHNELFNEEWGTEEYKTEESSIFTGGIYKYKIPFEHMKFERLIDIDATADPSFPVTDIQWGFCVDDNQDSYIGKPLVFYLSRETADISFVDAVNSSTNVATSRVKIENYFAPANSDLSQSQVEDRQSINFSPESDEWELTTTDETLFNNYHKNYISSVFNKSNRLTKITAYLPLRILHKYTLADRFLVAGKSYKINSIETDFYTGKSEIELLSDI